MPNKFFNYSSPYYKALSISIFFLALFLLSYHYNLVEHFTLEKLKDIVQQNTVYSLIFFIAIFIIGNFIQVPGLVFLAAAVITLGKINGGLVTYIAASISCITSFLVIRFMGGSVLRDLKYAWVKKIFNQLDQNPVRSIFILRSIFQTQPLLNYGLALSGVSFRHHLIATITALPLPIFLYCYFFDTLARSLGLN